MNPTLYIVVLSTDTLGLNMAKRLELDVHVIVAEDWPDFGNLIRAHHGSIGIVEFDPDMEPNILADRISAIQLVIRDNSNSRFLAVGKPDLAKIGRELLISGFANVFCSYADIGRMAESVVRHHNSVTWPVQTVEQAVAKNLPWDPVS